MAFITLFTTKYMFDVGWNFDEIYTLVECLFENNVKWPRK